MNCLQIHPGSSVLPLGSITTHLAKHHPSPVLLGMVRTDKIGVGRQICIKAASDSTSSTEMSSMEMEDEKKSTIYSTNMTQVMGAVLTYRHELGMNYNFILPDLIVGSCLQTPNDVDKLRNIGVKTVFCLQQNSDLEYFDVDIGAIQVYAKQCGDIDHVRAEIRDFDTFDLRMRLPAVLSKLCKAINCNGGVTYIHCTAGLGRAPSVALAYMFWVLGYKLSEANRFLPSKRSCFPNLEAIKNATADILTGLARSPVTLTWENKNYSSVEISGLDIGWGQRIPLKLDEDKGLWTLDRELPEGRYEYKYIIDGEWTCNIYELVTHPNIDGHVNNYINVDGVDSTDAAREVRKRVMDENIELTDAERLIIRQFLQSYVDDE